MTQSAYESAIAQTEELLTHYGFDLMGFTAQYLLAIWVKKYPALWVRLAVVEALYQGRYKAVSVEQILNFWSRKGDPNFHFNHEFERLICRKLPRYLSSFNHSSYRNRSDNHKKIYLPNSLIPEVEKIDDFTTSNNTESINRDISILQATTQEFKEKTRQFHLSPIDKFSPPSDRSNLYVKLKEVAFKS
jgi:hypothetical protein